MTATYRVTGQLNGRKAYATEQAFVSDQPADAFTGNRESCDYLARRMMRQRTHRTRTGDMFQNVEPYGWYEIGRNCLLVNLAPCLMPSSQNAMSLAEYESIAA